MCVKDTKNKIKWKYNIDRKRKGNYYLWMQTDGTFGLYYVDVDPKNGNITTNVAWKKLVPGSNQKLYLSADGYLVVKNGDKILWRSDF
jgi:hypothetical protein